MPAMHTTVTISRPLEDTFAVFLAPDLTAPTVDPSVESVTREPPGPTAPGTTLRFRQHALGATRETITRFTEIEPNRRIGFEARIGPMRPTCTLTFAGDSRRTIVTFTGRSRPIGPLRPLSSLFDHKGQRVWTERLGRIKALLEENAAAPTPDPAGGGPG